MLTEKEAKRLAEFYRKAENEILKQILRALLKGNQTAYLKGIEKNIQKLLKYLEEGGREWCKEVIPALYIDGAVAATEKLKKAGITGIKAGYGGMHQQAINALAQASLTRIEPIGSVIGRRVNDIFRDVQLEAVRGNVIGTNTWKQTAQIYKAELAKKGITGFTDRAGRQWNMKSYVQMVGRTVGMEAKVAGTANRYIENGYDLVKVTSHSNECEKCRPWEGKILSITGKTKSYKTLREARAAGLFHPNCRHDLTLYIV